MQDGLLGPNPVQRARKPARAYLSGSLVVCVSWARPVPRWPRPPKARPSQGQDLRLPPSALFSEKSLLLAFMFARQCLDNRGRLNQPSRPSRITLRANVKTTGGRCAPGLRRRGAPLAHRSAKQHQRATRPHATTCPKAQHAPPYTLRVCTSCRGSWGKSRRPWRDPAGGGRWQRGAG